MRRNRTIRGRILAPLLALTLIGGVLLLLPALSPPSAGQGARPAAGAVTANSVLISISTQASTAPIPLTLRPGDRFTFTLPSNRTTGYQWRLGPSPDPNVVTFFSSAYHQPSAAMPGQGGMEIWSFAAHGRGQTTITLEYARPFEQNTAPARVLTFAVTVQ
jgi:predicted secreted protein